MADALERYAEALGGPPRVELVEFAGRGALRQPLAGGLGLWLPMTWEGYVVPCREFVWVARIRVLGAPVLKGGDEFKGGKGRLRLGRRFFDGDGYDRAEYAVLWAWTLLLAPGEALARTEVMVEPAGPDAVRVAFPFRMETWECTLWFDPQTGLLRRLETHRFDPQGGRARRWSTDIERWGARGGRPVPEAVLTRWEGEPAVRVAIERLDVSAAGTG